MISRVLGAGCVAAVLLLTGPLPAEAQVFFSVRVVSVNVRNQGEGIVEVRFDDAVCVDKPQSPTVAIVRKARSRNFGTTVSMLTTAMLGNLLVSVQTTPGTCDIEFVWVRRPT